MREAVKTGFKFTTVGLVVGDGVSPHVGNLLVDDSHSNRRELVVGKEDIFLSDHEEPVFSTGERGIHVFRRAKDCPFGGHSIVKGAWAADAMLAYARTERSA